MKSQIAGICSSLNEKIDTLEEELNACRKTESDLEAEYDKAISEVSVRIRDVRQRITRLQTAVTVLQSELGD